MRTPPGLLANTSRTAPPKVPVDTAHKTHKGIDTLARMPFITPIQAKAPSPANKHTYNLLKMSSDLEESEVKWSEVE